MRVQLVEKGSCRDPSQCLGLKTIRFTVTVTRRRFVKCSTRADIQLLTPVCQGSIWQHSLRPQASCIMGPLTMLGTQEKLAHAFPTRSLGYLQTVRLSLAFTLPVGLTQRRALLPFKHGDALWLVVFCSQTRANPVRYCSQGAWSYLQL